MLPLDPHPLPLVRTRRRRVRRPPAGPARPAPEIRLVADHRRRVERLLPHRERDARVARPVPVPLRLGVGVDRSRAPTGRCCCCCCCCCGGKGLGLARPTPRGRQGGGRAPHPAARVGAGVEFRGFGVVDMSLIPASVCLGRQPDIGVSFSFLFSFFFDQATIRQRTPPRAGLA
ncbi:hypothetical protein VTN02DRAFT_6258 [Thermoascus thermophilus]